MASSDVFVITIDVGTSSTRALLFDSQASPVEGVFAQLPNTLHSAADGSATLDPEAILGTIDQCIDTVLEKAGERASRIAAVAVDTLVSNFIALDADGRALTPLILYADTRNAEDAEQLQRTMSEQEAHERTGCMLRTSYWPARIAWLQRTMPDVWARTARLATIGELLEERVLGRSRVSLSVASWSGLLNCETCDWDETLLGALRISRGMLGTLADASEPLHGLHGDYRSRWAALADVPWFPAIGDGAAANMGSGCTGPAMMALTVGTTGALRMILPAVDAVPSGLWCYRVDRKRALLGGATSEGGNVFAWVSQNLQLGSLQEAEQAVGQIAPDSHGLTVLPFFAGERSPGWAGDAKATIHGLTLSTTPAAIARAGMEAVAYRFAIIARLILPKDRELPRLIASGGAMVHSPLWMQICADALGLPLTPSAEPEATCRGIALLALESLGYIGDIADLPTQLGTTFQPNAEHHRIYAAAIARQEELYKKIVV